jgi:hypothetical protein
LYLQVAESMLYVPMCKMFDKTPKDFSCRVARALLEFSYAREATSAATSKKQTSSNS